MLAEEREKQIKKDIQIAFTKLAVYSSRRKKESIYTKNCNTWYKFDTSLGKIKALQIEAEKFLMIEDGRSNEIFHKKEKGRLGQIYWVT